MNRLKRNSVVAVVVLCVCAAVYLNWSYNNDWGGADEAMIEAENEQMENANLEFANTEMADPVSDYFAQARLTRQESRAEALALLEVAAASEAASQETIDSAMNEIAAMANFSMSETQVENQLLAKNFADCVVYMSDEGVTVAVPAPVEGLGEADIAKISDVIISETDYDLTQVNVIEVKNTGDEATDEPVSPVPESAVPESPIPTEDTLVIQDNMSTDVTQ